MIFTILTGAVIGYIATIVLTFVGVAIVHIFVLLLGGKGSYSDTYKALVYASTPSTLLGWIPLVGIVFGLYSLYLSIKGISKLHNISMMRAFLAVIGIILIILIIVIIMAAIAYALFASIFASMLGSSGGLVPMGEFPFDTSGLASESISDLIDSTASSMSTNFIISGVDHNTETGEIMFSLRNTGIGPIAGSGISVDIDGNVQETPCSGVMDEGDIMTCSFTLTGTTINCELGSTMTVTLPSGYSQSRTIE